MSGYSAVLAQTTEETSPAPNPALENLKLEKEKAELEAAIAKAQRERLESSIPTSETKALEGTASVDDAVNVEVHARTYQAVSALAHGLSKRFKEKFPDIKRIIIHREANTSALNSYKAVREQLRISTLAYRSTLSGLGTPPDQATIPSFDEFAQGVKALRTNQPLPPNLMLTPMAAAAVMRSVVDVAALFRVNTEIKGQEVTANERAVIAELGRFLSPEIKLYDPASYPVEWAVGEPPKILLSIMYLQMLKSLADQQIAAREPLLTAAKAANHQGEVTRLQGEIATLQALNTNFGGIVDSLAKFDSASGSSGMAALLNAEPVVEMPEDAWPLILKIAITGGNNRTSRNLFRTKVTANGAAIITYELKARDGSQRDGGTIRHLLPYTKVSALDKSNSFPIKPEEVDALNALKK